MGQQRTERKRAEKVARREAKANRKEAHVVEEKKRRIGNGALAIMIFGVVALMFGFVWGYNYYQKEASIETYIENHGGEDVYSNIMISDEQTLSVTAEKNDLSIVMDINGDDAEEDAEYYESDEGVEQLQYIAAYYLGSMKPSCRGLSASAKVVINLNDEELTTVDVKWSEVEDILAKYDMTVDDLQTETETTTTTTDDTDGITVIDDDAEEATE